MHGCAVEAKRLPRFNLGRSEKLRLKLKRILAEHAVSDRVMPPDRFRSLVDEFTAQMPRGTPMALVESLLSPLTMTHVTPRLLEFMAWRASGNMELATRGGPLSCTQGQAPDGWCAVRVTEVEPVTLRTGPRFRLYLFAECGPWAGDELVTYVTPGQTRMLAAHMGFSRSRKSRRRFVMERSLAGMRFMVHVVDCKDSSYRGPDIDMFGVLPSQKTRNRVLIRGRSEPCILHVPNQRCHQCHNGWDVCHLAYYPLTLERRACDNCREQNRLHDPRHPRACIHCRIQHAEQRAREYRQEGEPTHG